MVNFADNFLVASHPFPTSIVADFEEKKQKYRKHIEYSTWKGEQEGKEIVGIDTYNQRCSDYLTNNQYLVDWKVFPPIYLDFKHDLTKEVAMIFQECLSTFTSSKGVILCSYDSLAHADFLLKSRQVNKDRNYDNRLLLINTTLNAVVNMRITASKDADLVREEWKSCSKDIDEFIELHNKYLNKSKTVLISVVVAPNAEGDSDASKCFGDISCFCEHCNKLTLTTRELGGENRQGLKLWCKDVLPKYIMQLRSRHSMENASSENAEPCRQLAGQIIGYMASIPSQVPPLSGDVHTQIQNVQLNSHQINAYLCPKKKKIIKGCYGSGKSIIGKLQLETLIKEADEHTTLYYISFDPYSILDTFHKKCVLPLVSQRGTDGPQVNVLDLVQLGKELGISTVPVLSEVLVALSEKHCDNGDLCHIICDEFDGETLTEEEAGKVKVALERLDGSFVTILAQSLEKHRSDVKGNSVEHYHGFQYWQTGMEVIDLTKSMRNSVNVYNLISVAQKVVSKTPIKFHHPKLNKRNELVLKSENRSFNPFKQIETTTEPFPKSTSPASEEKGMLSSPKVVTTPIQTTTKYHTLTDSTVSVDFDSVFNLLDKDHYRLSSRKTIYAPSYVSAQGIGHSFHGNMPNLIYLPKVSKLWKRLKKLKINFAEQHISVLALFSGLQNIVKFSSVILCSDLEEVALFSNVLAGLGMSYAEYVPYLRNPLVFPDATEKEEAANALINGENVLTDRRGFRGMECKNIIMVINPDEYFNCQNLIENMARATCELILLVRSKPHKHKSRKSGIFNEVIIEWVENNLVNVIKPSYTDEQLLQWTNTISKNAQDYTDAFKISKDLLPR